MKFMKRRFGKKTFRFILGVCTLLFFAALYSRAPWILHMLQNKESLRTFMDVMKELDPLLAVAVVLVGFVSWIAARHDLNTKLDRLNEALKKNELQLVNLLLGGNLRIDKVIMSPYYALDKEKDGKACRMENASQQDPQEKCAYRMLIFYQKLSQRSVEMILLKSIRIKIKDGIFHFSGSNVSSTYWLYNEKPCLEFRLEMVKGGQDERYLSQFYFYYWQLQYGFETLEMDTVIEYRALEDARPRTGALDVKLRIEPRFTEIPEYENVEGLSHIVPVNEITVVRQSVSRVG